MTDIEIPFNTLELRLADDAPKRKRIRHPEPVPNENDAPPPDVVVTVSISYGDKTMVKSQRLNETQMLEPLEAVKFEGQILAAQAYRELEVSRLGEIANGIAPRSDGRNY